MAKRDKLSTDPYKGVRDFYPEDQFIQKYLFEHMSHTCELFGYEEYHASILEPAELYRSKASDEIVNEQTYTFTDRGDREVTLRTEMTPTLARVIAARHRDLPMPIRWYTIPNCFRYERPQRGRLREFWQLNADIVGASGIEADTEIITLAHSILRSFGATEKDFEIRVSDRRILDTIYDKFDVQDDKRSEVTRLLDKRDKLDDFPAQLAGVVGDTQKANELITEIDRTTSTAYLEQLRTMLEQQGVTNMIVDTKITRGFDYYTGMVFEVFDTNPLNRRSMFGGGRYDRLLELFSDTSIPAVGFGMGDVIARDFLEVHNLLPSYMPATEVMLCVVEPDAMPHATKLASQLRGEDIATAVNFSGKRLGDQIRHAEKMSIPFIIAIGSKERESGLYTLKNIATGHEITTSAERIAEHVFSAFN